MQYAGASATPTASTPHGKDWDAQSLHSDTVAGSTLGSVGSPLIAQGTSVESLRPLVQKRIVTLTYLRNVHEGRSHWFHTILITRADLEEKFNNNEMKRRTHRFAVLGMSLSNLLDINQPNDLLRGLMNVTTEYDQGKEDGEKPKMRLFRPKSVKRQGGYDGHLDSGDTSFLVSPHMPYPLDYHQTLVSLLDVLSEVYNKISKILGPSPLHQHMTGPLGLLSPHPGVSYLFSDHQTPNANTYANPTGFPHHQFIGSNSSIALDSDLGGTLWDIANASIGSAPTVAAMGGFMYPSSVNSPPTTWGSTLADMILKIDSKFKKIIGVLLKDLDDFARKSIADEVASLGPLLRNLELPGDNTMFPYTRPVYEVEGM